MPPLASINQLPKDPSRSPMDAAPDTAEEDVHSMESGVAAEANIVKKDSGDLTPFVIKRKRKKYRFALFANSPLCFEAEEWEAEWHADMAEIGAGTGMFSVDLASTCGKRIVAIDVKADRLQKGAGYAASLGRNEVRFLRARADQIEGLIPARSLSAVWLTFPDPFPKKRAAKHRLTHPRFLETYASLLAPGGSLFFKTDALGLFQWSLEQLVGQGWRIEELSFDLHESELSDEYKLMTTYERRFRGQGLPIGFLRATPPPSK